MDKIVLKNMCFYGYHGVLQSEKELGQNFYIDAELYLDLTKAGESDDLKKTVHYSLALQKIKQIVENECFDLIEKLAYEICETILKEFDLVDAITTRVRKPHAPVRGSFDYMEVEISRQRN